MPLDISALLGGFNKGIAPTIKSRQDQVLLDKEAQSKKALEILKGVIEGNLTPTTNASEMAVQAPNEVINKGFMGFGRKEQPGAMYKTQPNLKNELTQSQIDLNRAVTDVSGSEDVIYRDRTGQKIDSSIALGNPDRIGKDYFPSRVKVSKSGSTETPIKIEPTEQEQLLQDTRKKELQSMSSALPKLEQAEQAVKNLEQQYYRGYKPQSVKQGDILGGLMEKGRGMGAIGTSMAGASPELSTYMVDREAFSGLISKGGFGEAGMLTNRDIERVKKILPAPGDSEETAKAKWREVNAVLSSARQRYNKKLQEYTGKTSETQSPINNSGMNANTNPAGNNDPLGLR